MCRSRAVTLESAGGEGGEGRGEGRPAIIIFTREIRERRRVFYLCSAREGIEIRRSVSREIVRAAASRSGE